MIGAAGGGPRPLPSAGPRFGSGPVEGIRNEFVEAGKARIFVANSRGGAMSWELEGRPRFAVGFKAGGPIADDMAPALCAELIAGNEGASPSSSSSSSAELIWAWRERDGMDCGESVWTEFAFGVVCGDGTVSASRVGSPSIIGLCGSDVSSTFDSTIKSCVASAATVLSSWSSWTDSKDFLYDIRPRGRVTAKGQNAHDVGG